MSIVLQALLVATLAQAPRIGEELLVLPSDPIESWGEQVRPRTATGLGQALVVWEDTREGRPDVYAARIDATGNLLDPTGIPIATSRADEVMPVVAWNGTRYLVVWRSAAEIWAAFLAPDGTHTGPFAVSTGAAAIGGTVAVAFAGGEFLVVWGMHGATDDVGMARLDAQGALIQQAVLCSVGGIQNGVSVATDGTGFLVGWEDARSSNFDVFVSRVQPGTGAHDGCGLLVATGAGDQAGVDLAWNGTDFVLAWEDRAAAGGADLAAARVSPALTLVDAFPLCQAAGIQAFPRLARSGATVLATWNDRRTSLNGAIWAARLAGRVVVDPNGAEVAAQGVSKGRTAVAALGTGFVAVYESVTTYPTGTDVIALGLDPGGAALVPTFAPLLVTPAAARQADPYVGVSSGQILVAWTQHTTAGSQQKVGTRLSVGGAPLDDGGWRISGPVYSQQRPLLSPNDGGWLVVWGDDGSAGQVAFVQARLDAGIGPKSYILPSYAGSWAVSHTPGLHAVSYTRTGPFVQRALETGALVDTAPVALPGGDPTASAMTAASDESAHLLLWLQPFDAGGPPALRWVRFTPDGGFLDAAPRALVPPGGVPRNPQLAFGVDRYLVAFELASSDGGSDLWAARIATDGTALDPSGFRVVEGGGNVLRRPDAVWAGSEFLVSWDEDGPAGADIRGARVDRLGTVLDSPPIALVAGPDREAMPRAALLPSGELLLAYQRFDPSPGLSAPRVRARTVSFGAVDSGAVDTVDGGEVDGGTVDGGSGSFKERHYKVGCGCDASGAVSGAALLVLAAVTARRRPRS